MIRSLNNIASSIGATPPIQPATQLLTKIISATATGNKIAARFFSICTIEKNRNMRTKTVLIALSVAFSSTAMANPLPEAGKTIFTARCAACHNVNKQLTGPALAGVNDRRSIDWIIKFVQSSQTVIKSGDKDAVALFTQFNRIPMPDHADLTADDIKNIVEYIKSETVTTTSTEAPFAKPTSLRPNYMPLSINNYGFFAVILGLVALLLASLLAFVRVMEYARNTERQG